MTKKKAKTWSDAEVLAEECRWRKALGLDFTNEDLLLAWCEVLIFVEDRLADPDAGEEERPVILAGLAWTVELQKAIDQDEGAGDCVQDALVRRLVRDTDRVARRYDDSDDVLMTAKESCSKSCFPPKVYGPTTGGSNPLTPDEFLDGVTASSS